MVAETRSEIQRTVTEIVAAEFGIPVERCAPDLDLREVEGASSVKVLRAISKVEQRYDIELEDADVFSFTCVNDVVGAVDEMISTERR
jgi:acyl carrier protein